MPLPSFSGAQLASKCIASCLLPKKGNISGPSEDGKDLHKVIEDYITRGEDDAFQTAHFLCKSGELWAKFCAIPRELLDGYSTFESYAEHAFVYVPGGGGRRYGSHLDAVSSEKPDFREAAIFGVVDLVSIDRDNRTCYVVDWKTGEAKQTPVERNLQVCLAVAAVRESGLVGDDYSFVGRLVYTTLGQVDEHRFTRDQLDGITERARQLVAKYKSNKPRGFETYDYTTGEHCRYCPSFDACPAQNAIVRSFASGEHGLDAGAEVAEAARRIVVLEIALKRAKDQLKLLVDRTGPIDIGEGEVYGAEERARETIDGKKAAIILTEEVGRDMAIELADIKYTKTGLERALKSSHTRQLFRHVMNRMRSEGAIKSITYKRYGIFKDETDEDGSE